MSHISVIVRSRPTSSEVLFILNSQEISSEQAEVIVARLTELRGKALRNRSVRLNTEGGNFAITATMDHTLRGDSFRHYRSLRLCTVVMHEVLFPQRVRLCSDVEGSPYKEMTKEVNLLLDFLTFTDPRVGVVMTR